MSNEHFLELWKSLNQLLMKNNISPYWWTSILESYDFCGDRNPGVFDIKLFTFQYRNNIIRDLLKLKLEFV